MGGFISRMSARRSVRSTSAWTLVLGALSLPLACGEDSEPPNGDSGGGNAGSAADGGSGDAATSTGSRAGSGNRGGASGETSGGEAGISQGGSHSDGGGGAAGSVQTGGTGGNGRGGEGGDDAGAGGDAGAAGSPDPPPECMTLADCENARGPSPCGSWACNAGRCAAQSPNCTDADGDGFGAGDECACAGLDCDDDDSEVGSNAREICAVTPAPHGGCFQSLRVCTQGAWGACQPIPGEMTPGGEACNGEDEDCDGLIDEELGSFSCGMGACRRTVRACRGGVLGVCVPGTPTVQSDGCNGTDDDCDGAVDEDCATCIKVSPSGDDATAVASNGSTPFATVQAAIDFADTHRSVATKVCVAAGSACGATAAYDGPGASALTMRNGISVYGNYESTSWARCTNSTTTLAPQTAEGVLFSASVDDETILDGFVVERFASATTAAVTVDGASGVLLSNLVAENAPAATNSYGVNVVNGAEATIFRSRILGGRGSTESIGIRSVGSRVLVEDNCLSPDPATGRCDDSCAAGPAIVAGDAASSSSTAYGVLLRDSPGSRVERSAVCGVMSATGSTLRIAALGVEGDGDDIVLHGNNVEASMPVSSIATRNGLSGVVASGCEGAPWIIDNHSITAWALSILNAPVYAIDATGDCHPVVDSNQAIGAAQGSQAMGSSSVVAIRCAAAGGVGSRCVIAGNPKIFTAGGGATNGGPTLTTIDCNGSCAKVSRNTVIGRRVDLPENHLCGELCIFIAYPLTLTASGAFVDRNVITGGCTNRAVGVRVSGGWPRIQNNLVSSQDTTHCNGFDLDERAIIRGGEFQHGMVARGGDEVDVHSNRISSTVCLTTGFTGTTAAIRLEGRGGLFRNNRLGAAGGTCEGHAFWEANATADPIALLNNSLGGGVAWPYKDEGTTSLTTPQVNALTDMITGGNLEGGFTPGTDEGAPLWDFNGTPRGSPPDIGHLEQ